jgi:putative flippase GtrA
MASTVEQRRTFARFVMVGVSGAVVLFALTYAFERAGAAPIWGYALAYAIAFFFSYTLQRAWTFGARHKHNEAFPRYLVLQLFCAGTSAVTGQALTSWTVCPPILISAICTVLASALSFFGASFWVFSSRRLPKDEPT